MIISEVDAVLDLLEKARKFSGLLKDGWYKSSAELVTFPYKVESLTLKHKEWIRVVRKFGWSDDEVLTTLVEEAEKILSEEKKHVSQLKKSKFPRWRQRAFPGRLKEIVEAMEMRVNNSLQLLKSRDEMFGLLERDENRIEIPLPFRHDRKYVPIARSIAEVRTALERTEGSRVVIVHGDGGLGKTSLVKFIALHYNNVRRERPHTGGSTSQLFPDGVFYLSCGKGAFTRINELERELLESLGFGSEATTGDKSKELEGEYLAVPSRHHKRLRIKLLRRRALIIFDDVWEYDVLERLLIPGEGVKYLITSRRRDIWPDRAARRIPLEKPTIEDARKILAMYTELPKNIEETIDSIIKGVGFHPLMLANIGLAMGATGGSNPDEWKRMAKGWRDELHQRDFKYHPILHGQSYRLSMDDTINLMMESLEEGERSFLLMMSLLENERLPEVVVKFFRKCMVPGEAYFDYRRYRNQLHDKSLLEVYSPHVQGSGASGRDAEYSQTCLAVHTMRAVYIRKNYSEELRSMAIRAIERANQTKNNYANSWMMGRGLWGAMTATIDVVRSLVTWGSGPSINCRTGNSVISGRGGCGEANSTACGALIGIMAAMYIDKTLWDVTEPNTHNLLRSAYRDLSIIPGSVHGDVNVIDLVNTVRGKKNCIRGLVRLLSPDEEEGWKLEAHRCASKIIVRFICRQELDDISVAQLVQLHPDTTGVICDTLQNILGNGYWASKFVDHNITFSSVHSETTKTLFDLSYSDTTPINIRSSVFGILVGDNSLGMGILTYEDEETIIKVVMKVLPEITNSCWQSAFIAERSRTILVMGKIPDLRKSVVRLLLDKNQKFISNKDPMVIDRLEKIRTLSGIKSFAAEIVETPGALDMLWAQIGSSQNTGKGEWHALVILKNLTSLTGIDKKRFCANQRGLENLLDILTSSQGGEDPPKMLTNNSECFSPVLNGRKIYELTAAVAVLRNLAVTKDVQNFIRQLRPDVPEILHILERLFIQHAASARDLDSMGSPYDYGTCVSEMRAIFDGRLFNSDITDCNPPISPRACADVLRGRFHYCMAMEMYQEALDVLRDIPLEMYDESNFRGWRYGMILVKAMVKDYAGALVVISDELLDCQQCPGCFVCGLAYGHRGVLTQISGGNLAQAIADLDTSLRLIRSCFSQYPDFVCLYYIYYLLNQRGVVKHLMGDDSGAKADAHTAQELQRRNLVSDGKITYSAYTAYQLRILQLPVDYLGFAFSL